MEEWESCEGTIARPHRLIQVKLLTGRMINMDIEDSCPLCAALWDNHIQAGFIQHYIRSWRSFAFTCGAFVIVLAAITLWRC